MCAKFINGFSTHFLNGLQCKLYILKKRETICRMDPLDLYEKNKIFQYISFSKDYIYSQKDEYFVSYENDCHFLTLLS